MAKIATITSITGKAFAISADGKVRDLKLGDEIQKDEIIQTAAGGRVEMKLVDGQTLAVSPEQLIKLDEKVAQTQADQQPTSKEAAVAPSTADEVIKALERGGDLTEQLDATAAGAGGGGGGQGNAGFVRLLRISEGTDPLAYQYQPPEFGAVQSIEGFPAIDTTTPTIPTTPPTVTSVELKLFAVVNGQYVLANTIAEPGTSGGTPNSGTYVVLAVDGSGVPLGTQPGGTITVNVGASADTATRGDDYTSGATVTATVGTSFTISAKDDVLADNNESFTLSLGSDWSLAGNYETVTYSASTVSTTIVDETSTTDTTDNDSAYTFKLFAVVNGQYVLANTMTEETSATYVVLAVDGIGNPLGTQPTGTLTVNVGASGDTAIRTSDYVASSTYVATIGHEFSIDGIKDSLTEGSEYFKLSLLDGSWSKDGNYEEVVYTGTVTTTILDIVPSAAYFKMNTSNTGGGGTSGFQQFEIIITQQEQVLNKTVQVADKQGQQSFYVEMGAGLEFKSNSSFTIALEYGSGAAHLNFTQFYLTDKFGTKLWLNGDTGSDNVTLQDGETTNYDGVLYNVTVDSNGIPTAASAIGYDVNTATDGSKVLVFDSVKNSVDFSLDMGQLPLDGVQDMFGKVKTINMSGGNNEDNTLKISAQDVLDIDPTGGTLYINGDQGDKVVLAEHWNPGGTGTSVTTNGITYDLFTTTLNSNTVKLYIEQELTKENPVG
ncbi:MAG: hypothetical protein RL468_2606 [Pseudomonadota bacterium]|jgi:hypothetical protein